MGKRRLRKDVIEQLYRESGREYWEWNGVHWGGHERGNQPKSSMCGNAVCLFHLVDLLCISYKWKHMSHCCDKNTLAKISLGKKGILSYKSRLASPSSFQRSQVSNLK